MFIHFIFNGLLSYISWTFLAKFNFKGFPSFVENRHDVRGTIKVLIACIKIFLQSSVENGDLKFFISPRAQLPWLWGQRFDYSAFHRFIIIIFVLFYIHFVQKNIHLCKEAHWLKIRNKASSNGPYTDDWL